MDEHHRFHHERLDVYRAAIELAAEADHVIRLLPRGSAYLADQLHRAAVSVALNIAEGAGEFSAKEKARLYRIALRSATECAAALDLCAHRLAPSAPALRKARLLLQRIISMLTKLARPTNE